MSSLHEAVQKALAKFSLYSQEKNKDPLVSIRLFNAYGNGAWYLTEYNPKTRIAFGYVTGLFVDEWGYTSISEMAEVLFHAQIPMIEVDTSFTPTAFSKIKM